MKNIPLLLAVGAFLLGGFANAEPLVKDGQTIAFMGDSITDMGWRGEDGYVKRVVDGLAKEGVKITPIPVGIGGNKSNNMLARLDNDVLSKNPDWMTLSCGVNDVWHGANGVDLESYKKNIAEIADQAQAKGVKLIILTATVIGEDDNANNQKLAAYNDFLRAFAKERNLPLADLNADFWTILKNPPPGAPRGRVLTSDGVHMNPEGNVVMAKGVLRAFGVADVDKIEQQWLTEPGTGTLVGNFNFWNWPLETGLTLRQYRDLRRLAVQRKTDEQTLNATLLLKATGEAMQNHLRDETLNIAEIKKEIYAKLVKNVEALTKGLGD